MAKVIPLIGSSEAGPLGAIQLPRLWSKVLLASKRQLEDGYDECGGGFDQMLLDGLGLDRAATLKYIRQKQPTYPQFEQWVIKQKGGKISKAAINRSNKAIRAYLHPAKQVKAMSAAAGTNKDGKIKDALTLNALEDWNDFHMLVTKK